MDKDDILLAQFAVEVGSHMKEIASSFKETDRPKVSPNRIDPRKLIKDHIISKINPDNIPIAPIPKSADDLINPAMGDTFLNVPTMPSVLNNNQSSSFCPPQIRVDNNTPKRDPNQLELPFIIEDKPSVNSIESRLIKRIENIEYQMLLCVKLLTEIRDNTTKYKRIKRNKNELNI